MGRHTDGVCTQRALLDPVDVKPALREQPRAIHFGKGVEVAQRRDHQSAVIAVDGELMGETVGLPVAWFSVSDEIVLIRRAIGISKTLRSGDAFADLASGFATTSRTWH